MGNCVAKAPTKDKDKNEFVMSKANLDNLRAAYEIENKCLGSGSYGKVFKAKNKKDTKI